MINAGRFHTTKLALTIAVGLGTITGAQAKAAPPSKAVKAQLVKVQDTRKVMLVTSKKDSGFDFNKAGLELTFGLTVPDGKTLLRPEQPSNIKANDSTGKDLTAVEKGFTGRKEYIEMVQNWGKPPDTFTVTLAPPARSATRFNLTADIELWAFDDIKETSFTPAKSETPLDASLFGLDKVTAKLTESNNAFHIVITPGTVKHSIDKIELTKGSTNITSLGTMWNEASITYSFEGKFSDEMQAKLKVRQGMAKLPCNIDLTDIKLP